MKLVGTFILDYNLTNVNSELGYFLIFIRRRGIYASDKHQAAVQQKACIDRKT